MLREFFLGEVKLPAPSLQPETERTVRLCHFLPRFSPGTGEERCRLIHSSSTEPINGYGGLDGTSDEHSSIFAPGTLIMPGTGITNSDYLFFVAGGSAWNKDIGVMVLSATSVPGSNGQWTLDFPTADRYGYYPNLTPKPGIQDYGQVFHSPTEANWCPIVASGTPAAQDQTFDLNYAAAGSVVKDPRGGPNSLLMVYEGANGCEGSAGGPQPPPPEPGGAYITTGIATSNDSGLSWPTYISNTTFGFVPLPLANQTQGPNATAGATGNGVCMGTPPPPRVYSSRAFTVTTGPSDQVFLPVVQH